MKAGSLEEANVLTNCFKNKNVEEKKKDVYARALLLDCQFYLIQIGGCVG